MSADRSLYHVLFLCQHNRARSIFAEAIVNAMRARVHLLASLPVASLDSMGLQQGVSAIGRISGEHPPESN